MTPTDLLAEARRLGVRLAFRPPDTLSVDLPPVGGDDLLPLLREHKPAIIAALRQPPDDPCPVLHPGHTGSYWWQDAGGAWHCGRCQPDPRAARWQGVTLATLGDRAIVLRAPTGDLPAVGEWCRLPGGAIGDLLAYTPDGAEALVRLFSPVGQPEHDPPRFVWAATERLVGELEWSRKERA